MSRKMGFKKMSLKERILDGIIFSLLVGGGALLGMHYVGSPLTLEKVMMILPSLVILGTLLRAFIFLPLFQSMLKSFIEPEDGPLD